MSGVPQRKRNVSTFEFFNTAIEINTAVTKLMASESAVPKRYRFLVGVPTVETARSILANINRADAFYPNNSFNVLQRKKYLNLAIADCEQLCLDFQTIIALGLPATPSRLEAIVELVEKEIGLLKGARNAVKITGAKGRSYSELIEDAQQEIERLRDLQAEAEAAL